MIQNAFVFIDEIASVVLLKKLLKIFRGCLGVWAVTNIRNDDPSGNIKEKLPEFTWIQLDKALRNTKAITKEVKQFNAQYVPYNLSNFLNPTLKTLVHTPEGRPIINIHKRGNENNKEKFKRATEELSSGTKALICVPNSSNNSSYNRLKEILSLFEDDWKPLIYVDKSGNKRQAVSNL